MSKHIISISVFAIIVIGIAALFTSDIGVQMPVKEGAWDLSAWDFQSQGPVFLNGQWDFYWGKLISSQEIQRKGLVADTTIQVPKVWNGHMIDGKKLPGFGYATYHLKLKVKDPSQPLAIWISSISTAYDCYIDDVLVCENGIVGTSEETTTPYYKPMLVTFQPKDTQVDIIIQVSNFTYARGGIWYQIQMGTPDQIHTLEKVQVYKDAMIIGILLIMAFYFLSFHISRKSSGYRNMHFFSMCILLMVRTTLYGDYLMVRLFPQMPFKYLIVLTYMTIYWFSVALHRMIFCSISAIPKDRMTRIFYALSIALTAALVIVPVKVSTQWIYAIELFSAFIVLVALIQCIKAYLNRVETAWTILVGSMIIMVAGIHDVLYQANLVQTPLGELAPIGMVVFMFMISYLSSTQNAQLYIEASQLSQRLAKALETEKQLNQRLYELDRLKDEFLANTSHELKTPLNGILNITDSLLKGIGGTPNPVQEKNLEAVLFSSKRLLKLIDDLLDISAIRENNIRVAPAPLNLKQVVNSVLFLMAYYRNNKEVDLINEIPDKLNLVMADDHRLRQILINLIGNAVKFTNEGTIKIMACKTADMVRVTVADTGIGIEEAFLDKIFDAFEQLDGTVQRRQEGIGLGLYITKQLVQYQGGEIWIESIPGKGTQVHFTLPACADMAQIDEAVHQDTLKNAGDFTANEGLVIPAQILVVEDDAINRTALTNILELEGYQVESVARGRDVQNILKKGIRFQLIILDIMMPELSGLELLAWIREQYDMLELPVLMLTAKNRPDDIALAFQLGANDYLSKPFAAAELAARIKGSIKLKEMANQLVATEMAFLQAQIKPHFIFNALSVISSLSTKSPQQAKDLILDLSDYLRASFDFENGEGLTTLSREMELIHAYLSIEQARFKERLNITCDILEDADCTLPVLSIQPLVENAIHHGIMCRVDGGSLTIRVSLEADGRLKVLVADDGIGMNQEEIEAFLGSRPQRRGVGISNIHRRLKALYGEALHIESAPQLGTQVYFYIPYE